MSEDHLQFLKENFNLDYEEAVEEFHDELPLRLHFQEILEILNQNTITSSTPIRMKRPLYDLKYALAGCVMLAEKEREKKEKERERKAQNKRSLPSVSNAHNFVKNHWFLFWTWRKLLSIKKQLLQDMRDDDDDDDAAAKADQNSIKLHQPWDYQFFLEKEIYGFNDHLQRIEAFLFDDGPAPSDSIKALGIVGIGGSGKTALAKKVFCSDRVQESFYPMIWVELPLSPIPLQSIVTTIFERLSSCRMNDHDNDLGNLLRKMHNCLLNTKYLIVLDGVWHASDWFLDLSSNSNLQIEGSTDHFQHGLPKDSGGTIIITSRFQDVATKIVGEQNLYYLEPTLDRESCWSLILDSMASIRYQDPCWSSIMDSMHKIIDLDSRWSSIMDSMPKVILNPTLVIMKDEMIERCDGLPLAAKTLAEIISNNLAEEGLMFTESFTLDKIKLFCLRINKPHQIPISKVLEYIRIHREICFNALQLEAGLSRLSCEAKIVSSVQMYNDGWGFITISISSHMFNQQLYMGRLQQLDTNPLSPSLLSYRFALFFFLDPNATKEFWMSVNSNDNFNEILQHLRVRSDVSQAQSTHRAIGRGEIKVETNCNPLELMKDLRKHYEVEINDARIIVSYKKVRKNYKAEIVDSCNKFYYTKQENRKLCKLPQMIQKEVNSQINSNPPSPGLSYIIELFQDSTITKMFHLRFDKHDDIFLSLEALEKVHAYSGVCDAYINSSNINEIEGIGRSNLLGLMKELNKLVKAEIISFLKMS